MPQHRRVTVATVRFTLIKPTKPDACFHEKTFELAAPFGTASREEEATKRFNKGVPLDNFPKNAVYCDVPPSFIQKNIIYVVIVLGTAIVLLLFYFMHKRIKKVRETEWQEHLHLLENILDNLPIAASGIISKSVLPIASLAGYSKSSSAFLFIKV